MDSSTGNANEKAQRETISLSLPAIGSSASATNDNHDQRPNSLGERSLSAQSNTNTDLNSHVSINSNADNSNEL